MNQIDQTNASLDYAQFSTNSGKGGAGSLKLFMRMGRRHLDTNSRLAFRNNRVTEPHDIYPFLQEPFCHSGRERSITQHDWDDGMLAGNESEPKHGELCAEERSVLA